MNSGKLPWLEAKPVAGSPFPAVEHALCEPDGLLAAGGCLTPDWLLHAYTNGIFPWFSDGEPILWWSPDPRSVLFPDDLKISRSLRKTIKKNLFSITFDKAFSKVIRACAAPRKNAHGTWITTEMIAAYDRLHQLGIAHSAEARLNGKLVGGVYGVHLGQVFFGESMFHHVRDASKVAFVALIEQLRLQDCKLIDCQVHSKHLQSLGATEIPRAKFIRMLKHYCPKTDKR